MPTRPLDDSPTPFTPQPTTAEPDRRQVLAAGAAAAATVLLNPALTAAAPRRPDVYLWLRLNKRRTPDEWKAHFELLASSGVEGVMAQVYPNSHARYGSRVLPNKRRTLEVLLPAARAAGVDVHAWIHCMLCNVPYVKMFHRPWYAVSRQGKSTLDAPPYSGHYKFLCPTRKPVRQFLRSIVAELAAYDGVAGVHLDFIRHPDVFLPPRFARRRGQSANVVLPQHDFCYCDVCRKSFEQETGIDPKGALSRLEQMIWDQFRLDRMTDLVTELAEASRAQGKRVSAAVFPTPAIAKVMVRQDWTRWPVDAVMPMLYHRNFEQPLSWVEDGTRQGVQATNGRLPIYSGLLMSSIPTSQTRQAIRFAQQGGARGVALFNANKDDLALLR